MKNSPHPFLDFLMKIPTAKIHLGFWFILQLIDGLTSLGAVQSGGGVAFFAHIGGFVAGALMTRLIILVSPRMRGPATPPTVG